MLPNYLSYLSLHVFNSCFVHVDMRKNFPMKKTKQHFFPVTSTTTRPLTPSPSNQAAFKGRKPNQKVSPCVLAIVNCCSRYDSQVRTSCFEQYRCSGAFFGRNPCSSPEIKAAAFREVEKFSK